MSGSFERIRGGDFRVCEWSKLGAFCRRKKNRGEECVMCLGGEKKNFGRLLSGVCAVFVEKRKGVMFCLKYLILTLLFIFL